jgi:dihydroflavonol-4-reductase
MLVLVTGAGGFLGAHIVRALLRNGDEVRALVRPKRPRNHIRKIGVELIDGDILHEQTMIHACNGVDAVIHCASLVSYWKRQKRQMQRINVEGPMILLRAAKLGGARRFVHVSTAGTLGPTKDQVVLDEGLHGDPRESHIAYLDTKLEGESRVLAAAWGGFPALVVNPSMMLGPRLDGLPPSPLIAGIMRGRLPWVPPGGISVTDVTDVAEATVRALRSGRPGERYLLGGHNVSWEQLYQAIADNADGRLPKKHLSQRQLATRRVLAEIKDRIYLTRPPWTPELYRSYGTYSWYRSDKAARELGYLPRPLSRIVRHTVRKEVP